MLLYHTSYGIIDRPDIHFGRKNADFGQGFYLSESYKFAGKWVREKKAVGKLKFISAREIDNKDITGFRAVIDREEEEYQKLVADTLEKI